MARTRQYTDRVNIIKMIKLDGKWRFAPVVERDGKITRDHVLVNGKYVQLTLDTQAPTPSLYQGRGRVCRVNRLLPARI